MKEDPYIGKWLNGTLSDEEKQFLAASPDYAWLMKLSGSLGQITPPAYDTESELIRLKTAIPIVKKIQPWHLNPWLRTAAVLVVLMSAFFYFYLSNERIIIAKSGETTVFFLPDSSRVILNAQSSLRYKKYGWMRQRLVKLDGEGYFEVAHGSAFDVVTSQGNVSVLGTRFNVRKRMDLLEVACYEGSVQVVANSVKHILNPGDGYRSLQGAISTLSLGTDEIPGWLLGQSIFVSVPLHEVIAEFERQYNLKVDMTGVDGAKIVTITFGNSNRDAALSAITIPVNLTWSISDNTVILKARGE